MIIANQQNNVCIHADVALLPRLHTSKICVLLDMDDRSQIAYKADVLDKQEATINNMSGSSYATLWREKEGTPCLVTHLFLIPPVTLQCLAESSVPNPSMKRHIIHWKKKLREIL